MQFRRSIEIDAPAAEAWAVLEAYADDPRWRREVVSMVPMPAGAATVGTTTVEVGRMLGMPFTAEGVVVGLVPGRSLTWKASSPAIDVSGERAVEPLGDARCRVTLSYDLRPKGVNRLMSPVLGRAFQRGVEQNLTSLAQLLQGVKAAG